MQLGTGRRLCCATRNLRGSDISIEAPARLEIQVMHVVSSANLPHVALFAWQCTFTARVRSWSFLLRCSFSPISVSSSEVVPSSSQGPSWGSQAAAPLPFGGFAFVRAAGVSLYSLPSPAHPCICNSGATLSCYIAEMRILSVGSGMCNQSKSLHTAGTSACSCLLE